jgi:hypothetical protein
LSPAAAQVLPRAEAPASQLAGVQASQWAAAPAAELVLQLAVGAQALQLAVVLASPWEAALAAELVL